MLPVCHDQTDNPARSGPSSLVCGSWNAHAASHWNNIESCISTQWKHFHSGFTAIWFYFLFTFIPPKLLLSKVWPVWIKWCMLNTTLKFRTIIKGFHQVYLSHKKTCKSTLVWLAPGLSFQDCFPLPAMYHWENHLKQITIYWHKCKRKQVQIFTRQLAHRWTYGDVDFLIDLKKKICMSSSFLLLVCACES